MNFQLLVLTLLFFSSLLVEARDFRCTKDQLVAYSDSWVGSPDFMTVNFDGPSAASIFSGLGAPQAQHYSVILRHEWCRPLQDAVLCETPNSALVEVHSLESPSSPVVKSTLRYFLFILNYKETGWAFLKVRGKRMDLEPPISFHTQFPDSSCLISEP